MFIPVFFNFGIKNSKLKKNNNETTSAIGHFVHVLVDKKNRRPIKLPEKFIKALAKLK